MRDDSGCCRVYGNELSTRDAHVGPMTAFLSRMGPQAESGPHAWGIRSTHFPPKPGPHWVKDQGCSHFSISVPLGPPVLRAWWLSWFPPRCEDRWQQILDVRWGQALKICFFPFLSHIRDQATQSEDKQTDPSYRTE